MQAICCREGADHCYDKEETMTYTTRRMSLLAAGFGLMVTVVPSRAGPPNNDVSDSLRNTAGGSGALHNNTTGFDNTAFGFLALTSNKAGDSNTAFGKSALRFNTTGTQNTAVGLAALGLNTGNVAMGVATLQNNTSGASNLALGVSALQSNTTGSGNIAIGLAAGAGLFTGSSNIYLGAQAKASNELNTMRLGQSQSSTFIAGVRGAKTGLANAVAVFIDGNGQLGTINSAARFKEDIREMGDYSRGLYKLRPVTYRYKEPTVDGAKPLESGLIAEEVAKEYSDLVAYGSDGQIETVQYHKLTPMLLNEVQHQEQAFNLQRPEIADVKAQNQTLRASIKELRAEMQTALASRHAQFIPPAQVLKTATR